jgi:hypothetical protein
MSRTVHILATAALFTATSTALGLQYPVDGDNTYTANVMRQYSPITGQLTTTAVGSPNLDGGASAGRKSIDGSGDKSQWSVGVSNDPDVTGWVRYTLAQPYVISKFVHDYTANGYRPQQYEISVSTTGFDSMTVVRPMGATNVVGVRATDVIAPTTVQYIEYRWQGTGAQPFVLLEEFFAFADITQDPVPSTSGKATGYNGTRLTTDSITNVGTNNWIDALSRATDGSHQTYIRGNGQGDAAFVLDLGIATPISAITLGFYQGQQWANGVLVEISLDGLSYVPVFDTNAGTGQFIDINLSLASVFDNPVTRFVRVTNKGGAGGALTEIEVFAVPEPAAAGLGAIFGAFLLARRRRG